MTRRIDAARFLPTALRRPSGGLPSVSETVCPDRDDAAALAALAVLRTLGRAAKDAPAPVRRAVEMAEARRLEAGLGRAALKADAFGKLSRLLAPAAAKDAPRLERRR